MDQGTVGALGSACAAVDRSGQGRQRVPADAPGLIRDQHDQDSGQGGRAPGGAPTESALGHRFGEQASAGGAPRPSVSPTGARQGRLSPGLPDVLPRQEPTRVLAPAGAPPPAGDDSIFVISSVLRATTGTPPAKTSFPSGSICPMLSTRSRKSPKPGLPRVRQLPKRYMTSTRLPPRGL